MLSKSLLRTLKSFFSLYFLVVLAVTAAITAIIGFIYYGVILVLLEYSTLVSLSWLEYALDWVGEIGAHWVWWLLFPSVVPLAASVLLEFASARIETKEYGGRAPLPSKLLEEILSGVQFAAFSLFFNLLLMPALFIPPLYAFLYYSLNSYLVGREFYEMAAARYLGFKQARYEYLSHKITVWLAGGCILLATLTPVLMLVAPLLGITLMVHLWQSHRQMQT